MKLKVKITGSKVHEVGYRVFLLRKALELGVERFNAYNTKENGMQVLNAFLEGNKNQNAAFKEFANENKPEDAKVSGRVFEDYEGYVKDTKFSLSAFIEEKYQKLEGEIAEIKATLAKMQAAG